MTKSSEGITRRDFVADSTKLALGAAAFTIVPRHVLGRGYQAPSDTLNIAIVGCGGMGMSNAEALTSQNIVALCDIDFKLVDRNLGGRDKDREGKERPSGVKLQEAYRKAARYSDFRVMLEKQKNIDAVLIATPDHLHAVIAAAAMRAGKHVYVQKPLTYTVKEARVLRDLARSTGVVTQMGNQGHSSDDARRVNEWIQAGMIGPVREVHVWTNRPIWPQGIPRPGELAAMADARPAGSPVGGGDMRPPPPRLPPVQPWGARSVNDALASAMMNGSPSAVPEGLNWDLFLGPGPEVPYHPVYHPFNWRGWVDWGVGALGDMGAHLIDHPYWALGLGLPTTIEATSTPWGGLSPYGGAKEHLATYPLATTVHYQFAARGTQPPVMLSWYDGGLMPPRPDILPPDLVLDRQGGVMYIGEKGILLHETYGKNPRLLPDALMQPASVVPRTYVRVETSHEMNWALACKGQGKASSPFEYAAPLTETMLLGIVALRTGQGKKILYDGEAMRVTNVPEANQYLQREYRKGWTL
ncbi:MAG: Gfo/Idh/MocA family oxidoreductase [Gemmatimonadaceae bacterium]